MSSPDLPEPAPQRAAGPASSPRVRSRVLAGIVVALAVIASLAGVQVISSAATLGPDPTLASLTADGPFATESIVVPPGNGFGGGEILAPTDTSQGKFGAISWAPGMGTGRDWYLAPARKLASFGFVVFVIDTNAPGDMPDARADQLLASLDWLTSSSSVAARVDAARLAVTGHSAGGGGALIAASRQPSLKAAMGLAAFIPGGNLSGNRVPTMLVAGARDSLAASSKGAYDSLPAGVPKAYAEITEGGHEIAIGNPHMVRLMIPWAKVFIDGDSRYEPFLCDSVDEGGLSDYQATCPLGSPQGQVQSEVQSQVQSPA